MVWSPNHGDTAFTVPLFDLFMKRVMPKDDWMHSEMNRPVLNILMIRFTFQFEAQEEIPLSANMLDLPNRPRRLRRTPAIRSWWRRLRVNVEDLIYPLFVIEGDVEPEAVESMPGVFRRGIKDLVKECKCVPVGDSAVAIFPKFGCQLENDEATEALNPETLVLRAVRAIKEAVPGLVVITDLALDPYTTHGHDGILSRRWVGSFE